MTEPLIRGYVLDHTARFYRSTYDYSTAARIEGDLSLEVKSALETVSHADWYPRRYQVEMLNAFAAARGSSDVTYGDFMRCGAKLGEPNNDFAKLLIQLMTPELFLRKLPRFWTRDLKSSGAFEIEMPRTGARGAKVKLRNVKQYDHGAIFWMGFIQSTLAQLGASGLVVTQEGWSWSNPGPQDISYDVRWS
jgi:hypothetical protein